MPNVVKETRETRSDPKRLHVNDITDRQRPAAPRRQRDAARRGRALVDGRGVINETVLVCRAAARLAAQDKAARMRGGSGAYAKPIGRRWGAFLRQGSTRLTTAQAGSLRKRSTRAELLSLEPHQRALIGPYL